jgi:hypothetical protein
MVLGKQIFIILLTVSLIAFLVWVYSTSGTYYKTYSPDRQYSVYAEKYNWEMLNAVMPGGGGDHSGKLFLYDEVKKKVIGKAETQMISRAGDIMWGTTTAYYVGDEYPTIINPWKLPRPVRR